LRCGADNMVFLRRLVSAFPERWQQELRRFYYGYQIRRHAFETGEPEFLCLGSMISAGDWVIDIGANIGHYTKKSSDLVGPQGRVIAVEPVPATFALLAANVSLFQYSNVTLLNVAASDQSAIAGMDIPRFETGLNNYYGATLSQGDSARHVLTLALDSLDLPHRITLIKIDTEGHDAAVLHGLEALLRRDHPILIVETSSPDVVEHLTTLGYKPERLLHSPNTIFR
jgi:FkbM family methyltransferase